MVVPLSLQVNRRASAEEVLAAQQLAVKVGLPITASARVPFSSTARTLEAKAVIEAIYAQLKSLGEKPETKTVKLDWKLLEARLSEVIENPEMSMRAGAKSEFPLLAGTNVMTKVILAEAERRIKTGETRSGEALYRTFRKFACHNSFQQTLISMLVGVSQWKRYAASLSGLAKSQQIALGADLFEPIPPLKIKQILDYEFAFQWDSLSPRGQIGVPGAKSMNADKRSERYIFLKNWSTLYPQLSKCRSCKEAGDAYAKVLPKLLPFFDLDQPPQFAEEEGPRYTLDVIDWHSLGDSLDETQALLARLRSL